MRKVVHGAWPAMLAVMDMEEKNNSYKLSVLQTINALILSEIKALIYPCEEVINLEKKQQSPFIKFLPLATSIEFMGACYDEFPFDCTKETVKKIYEKRFNKALKELFDKKYHKFANADSKHYRYIGLRCGMVHQMRPGPGILFTTRKESIEDNNPHLSIDDDGGLILVLEDLYDDIEKAANGLIRKFEENKLSNKKGDQAFLKIKDYKKQLIE